MMATEHPAEDLPLLTTVVEEASDELPTLTDVVGKTHAIVEEELPVLMEAVSIEPASHAEVVENAVPSPALSEADIQRLIQQLEAHLESVFAQKLGHRLEQLQRLAVDQAIRELKAELPQMLRDALHSSAPRP
jgi:hypothetical protein